MAYHRLKSFLYRTVRRRQAGRDLDEEIRAHLAIDKQDRLERGETAEFAGQNARRTLGNELLIKEVTRDMWGWATVERIWRDFVYALRQLRRSPGFAAVAILSLALGIGANSAIFSILNALLFKSLPVRAPDELFVLHQQSRATVPQRFSYPMFLRFRDAGSGAAGVAAMSAFKHCSKPEDKPSWSRFNSSRLSFSACWACPRRWDACSPPAITKASADIRWP